MPGAQAPKRGLLNDINCRYHADLTMKGPERAAIMLDVNENECQQQLLS